MAALMRCAQSTLVPMVLLQKTDVGISELRQFDVCTQCVIFYVSVQKYLRLFHNQRGSDEILRYRRDILEELIWESQIVLRNIAERFLLRLASEWRVARQQDVCQHTNRP